MSRGHSNLWPHPAGEVAFVGTVRKPKPSIEIIQGFSEFGGYVIASNKTGES
jgi:hypothetical protein